MSEEVPESKKTGLAIVIAQGASVPAWARRNEVPTSTAYYWAGQPEVRRMVETLRRRSLDRAVGRMASRAVAVVTVHVDSCFAEGIAYSDSAVFVCNIDNSFVAFKADFEGRADSSELLLAAGVDHAEVVMRAD